MNLTASAMRRPFTTVMLVVALASGGALGVSKVRTDILRPLKTPKVHAALGSTGRAPTS